MSRPWRLVSAALLVLLLVGLREITRRPAPTPELIDAPSTVSGAEAAAILQAFQDRRSGIWVEGSGRVERLLADDDEGSRHQRFIVRMDGEHTLLISHNIDLAARLPIDLGDSVSFRGMYEWNDRGGVIHWTHHDPEGRHGGGWLVHSGREYR